MLNVSLLNLNLCYLPVSMDNLCLVIKRSADSYTSVFGVCAKGLIDSCAKESW